MFFLALTAARSERFGRVARCKKNKQTLKHNDTYLSNLIGGSFGGRLGAVGGGTAPVHGLPLDCGRAAGGTEVIRHVAGRLSLSAVRRTRVRVQLVVVMMMVAANMMI